MRSRTWWVAVSAFFLVASGCGESTTEEPDNAAGTGGTKRRGGGGTAGSSGSSGSSNGGNPNSGSSNGGAAGGGNSTGGAAGSAGDDTPGGGEGGSGEGGDGGDAGSDTQGGMAGLSGAGSGVGGASGSGGSASGSGGSSAAGGGAGGASGGSGGTTTVPVSQASPGDLVISEIMRDPGKVDDSVGEWFEIYNAAMRGYDLSGLGVADNAGQVTVSQSVVIPPGGYVVLARSASGNGGISPHFVYGNALQLANAADVIRLSVGATVIDEVAFDGVGVFPTVAGASMSFRTAPPSASGNDIAGNWCAAGTAFGAGDMGTPGAANGGCLKRIAEMVPGDLVITEIMANPNAVDDTLGEWFEIKNVTNLAFDLSSLVVRDLDVDTFTVANTLLIAPNGRLVLGANSATGTNGGAAVDYDYDRAAFAIANGTDEIVLSTTVVIDQVLLSSTFPQPAGASISLSPASETAGANDTATNWCAATTAFGAGDYGTPGAANSACP